MVSFFLVVFNTSYVDFQLKSFLSDDDNQWHEYVLSCRCSRVGTEFQRVHDRRESSNELGKANSKGASPLVETS